MKLYIISYKLYDNEGKEWGNKSETFERDESKARDSFDFVVKL